PVCHLWSFPRTSLKPQLLTRASKPISPPPCNDESRKTQEVHTSCKSLQTAGTFAARPSQPRIFRSFAGSAGSPRVSDFHSRLRGGRRGRPLARCPRLLLRRCR